MTDPKLADAALMWLQLRPVSPAALSLVATATALVGVWEARQRGRGRGISGQAKLTAAVGAIIGGLLRNWRKTDLSYRVQSKQDFDPGSLVSYDQFVVGIDGLVALDLVEVVTSGKRFATSHGFGMTASGGHAPRFRPMQSLLAAATKAGVLPSTLNTDWERVSSLVAPKVGPLVTVRVINGRGRRSDRNLPPASLGPALAGITASVDAANAFAREHAVSGCLQPRWRRQFGPDLRLYGRWHAAGSEGAYQSLPADERQRITIDGQPVVEVDVSGSHLTIMLGLLGWTDAPRDPYDIGSVIAREVLKQWVLVTLGKGSPPSKLWPANARQRCPKVADHAVADVRRAMVARYSFLDAPAAAVACQAGLAELAALVTPATPERALTHRLMGIEAAAITDAMTALRTQGVLALPVHDSLIVPEAARRATMQAMAAAFKHHAGIVPNLKVEPRHRWDF